MSLLTQLTVKNFRCFRGEITLPFTQSNYIIGANNAGKTAVLSAINYFFDNSLYSDESFLNRTEYQAKKEGYNRCEITIDFDLSQLTSRELKRRLIKYFEGNTAKIKKIIVFSPIARRFTYTYQIKNTTYDDLEVLDNDIKRLLKSVSVTYIHPQEGRQLLENAQDKLKQRLLANWGRNPRLSHSIQELQDKWDDLSKQARTYLSSSLTENIQKMWPGSSVSIDLPDIKDIVAISDITFQGNAIVPEIELTAQGTGAQSSVLYLAHYLLDSDRSLHRGEYHPIWLLEEPESFLHADLVTKFGSEINSEAWLGNIQFFVATHSPLMLATSRSGGRSATWSLMINHELKSIKNVEEWSTEEINDIGKIMGDLNFQVYFSVSKKKNSIFIEDSKDIVKEKMLDIDINVEQGLNGVPEIKKYIYVLINSPILVDHKIFFIVDGDQGIKDLQEFIPQKPKKKSRGFKKYKVINSDNIYLVSLPENKAMEDLFSEFDLHLDNCVNKIWGTEDWQFRSSIPANLTRVHAKCRNKATPRSMGEAHNLIKNHQDVKDLFWERVEVQNHTIEEQAAEALKELIENGA